MKEYDPRYPPHPEEWLDLEEEERLELVIEAHRRDSEELPNEVLHATIHVVVENQLALGAEPVPETLERLQRQGLDRHDAVHALGAVLAEHVHQLLTQETLEGEAYEEYAGRLQRLTAKRWRKGTW